MLSVIENVTSGSVITIQSFNAYLCPENEKQAVFINSIIKYYVMLTVIFTVVAFACVMVKCNMCKRYTGSNNHLVLFL